MPLVHLEKMLKLTKKNPPNPIYCLVVPVSPRALPRATVTSKRLAFTSWGRPFKLEVSTKPASQDLISNQGEARKTPIPNDITWGRRQGSSKCISTAEGANPLMKKIRLWSN